MIKIFLCIQLMLQPQPSIIPTIRDSAPRQDLNFYHLSLKEFKIFSPVFLYFENLFCSQVRVNT